MGKLEDIINGWGNLALGNHQELAEKRAKICADCPIFKDNFCNKELGGCGCFIPAKTSCVKCNCPKEKW